MSSTQTINGQPAVYNSGTITLRDGSGAALQLDINGNLKVTGSFSIAGGATSANQTSGAQKTQIVDGSGNVIGSTSNALNVAITSGGSGGTSSSFAAAFPATGTAIGVKNGANMVNLTADGSGNLNTSITTALPAGTNVIGHTITDTGSTTAVTGTVTISGTVTANAGSNLNTSLLALDTSVNGILVAQASTTSGQTGPLVQTATTTSAPTYTTAKTNPLSTTTAGALRIDGSGVIQPVSLTSTTITGTVATTQSTSPWIVAGGGTAGTAASGVATVQGIASMTPIQVSQATAGNLNATVVNAGTFAVQATQSGNWSTRTQDGSGTAITSTGSALDINVKSGSIANTSFIATQTTAANLNATVVGTGTFAVQAAATLAAETTKVIGTVRTADGSGNLLTSTTNALDINIKSGSIANTSFASTQSGSWNVSSKTQDGGGTPITSTGSALDVSIKTSAVTFTTLPSAGSTATGTAIYNNTALTNTKQAVNASPGNLYGYHIYNPNGNVIYVQLFNVASGSVTVGTTTPTAVLAIPPAGFLDSQPGIPIAFGTALTIAATTTSTGSTAPSSTLLFNAWYK